MTSADDIPDWCPIYSKDMPERKQRLAELDDFFKPIRSPYSRSNEMFEAVDAALLAHELFDEHGWDVHDPREFKATLRQAILDYIRAESGE